MEDGFAENEQIRVTVLDLSADTLVLVLSFLESSDILNCSHVARGFRQVIHWKELDEAIWKKSFDGLKIREWFEEWALIAEDNTPNREGTNGKTYRERVFEVLSRGYRKRMKREKILRRFGFFDRLELSCRCLCLICIPTVTVVSSISAILCFICFDIFEVEDWYFLISVLLLLVVAIPALFFCVCFFFISYLLDRWKVFFRTMSLGIDQIDYEPNIEPEPYAFEKRNRSFRTEDDDLLSDNDRNRYIYMFSNNSFPIPILPCCIIISVFLIGTSLTLITMNLPLSYFFYQSDLGITFLGSIHLFIWLPVLVIVIVVLVGRYLLVKRRVQNCFLEGFFAGFTLESYCEDHIRIISFWYCECFFFLVLLVIYFACQLLLIDLYVDFFSDRWKNIFWILVPSFLCLICCCCSGLVSCLGLPIYHYRRNNVIIYETFFDAYIFNPCIVTVPFVYCVIFPVVSFSLFQLSLILCKVLLWQSGGNNKIINYLGGGCSWLLVLSPTLFVISVFCLCFVCCFYPCVLEDCVSCAIEYFVPCFSYNEVTKKFLKKMTLQGHEGYDSSGELIIEEMGVGYDEMNVEATAHELNQLSHRLSSQNEEVQMFLEGCWCLSRPSEIWTINPMLFDWDVFQIFISCVLYGVCYSRIFSVCPNFLRESIYGRSNTAYTNIVY